METNINTLPEGTRVKNNSENIANKAVDKYQNIVKNILSNKNTKFSIENNNKIWEKTDFASQFIWLSPMEQIKKLWIKKYQVSNNMAPDQWKWLTTTLWWPFEKKAA